MRKVSLFLLLTLFAITSCNKEDVLTAIKNKLGQGGQNSNPGLLKGPEVQVGGGKVCSFLSLSPSGVPVEIGFEIDSLSLELSALNNETNSFTIPLHKNALGKTAFDHLQFNWIPPGKRYQMEGLRVYPWDFGFQYYTIPVEAQMAIPEYSQANSGLFFTNGDIMPDQYIPMSLTGTAGRGATYVYLQGLREPSRTSDILYGYYDKKMVFYEHTMTKAVLQAPEKLSRGLPARKSFLPSNTYYPTTSNIYKDSGKRKYYVSLTDFVLK